MSKLGYYLTTVVLIKGSDKAAPEFVSSLPSWSRLLVVQDCKANNNRQPPIWAEKSSVDWVQHPLDNDFASQRNAALEQVTTPWTLFLDSDEVPDNGFWNEVQKAIEQGSSDAYCLHRRQVFLGQVMRFGEGGHQYPLRLARTDLGQDQWQRAVHEVWAIESPSVGLIDVPVWHYSVTSLHSFLAKLNRYSDLEIKTRASLPLPTLFIQLGTYPVGKFIYNYFFKLGFLDGWRGFLEAALMSYYSAIWRIKYYEKIQR